MPHTIPDAVIPHRRTAYRPDVVEGDDDPKASKLGGTPWLPEGTTHPVCPNCNHPMPLLLQLDVATLPDPARYGGTGLLQLFYCTNAEPLCEVDCEAFFPNAKSVVARRVDSTTKGAASAVEGERFEAKRIVGWEATDDYPNWEEGEELGITGLDDATIDALGEDWPLTGEKLAGWPAWVQGIEYPECTECGEPQALVFQIDSEGLLDYGWGDMGVAHLTQCSAHPDHLSFGWACG